MPTERKVLAVSAAVVVVSASALTALAGGTAHAQFAPPSTARAPSAPSAPSKPINLQVDVQPTAVFGAGNVTRVSYVVANTPRSTDRLSEFAVRSPVPVWRLEVPAPKARYLGVTREGRDDVAGWGWVDDMPRPGESSPVLAYEAIGLPGVVPYRALRYGGYDGSGGVRPTAQSGESGGDGGGGPRELRFHRAGAEYVVGKTVGVVPLPLDVRPAALANRLRRLVDESCELGWITSMTVCRSLRADARPSARALRAFHGELVAHRGKAVGEAAFALLAPNAEFLLTKM